MALPRKQRRTDTRSPSPDFESASPNTSDRGSRLIHRKAKKQVRSSSQIASASEDAKDRTPGGRETSLAQGSWAASHDVPSDVIAATGSEEYSSASGSAPADLTALAAKWTPLLKAEAALVVWDGSRYGGHPTVTSATLKTQEGSLEKSVNSQTSGAEMAASSDTVAACGSSRSSTVLAKNENAKASDPLTTEERTSCGLFELWKFCCVYVDTRRRASRIPHFQAKETVAEFREGATQDPRNALCGVGLRLTGPYDLLAGDLPLGRRALLAHARGFYDMPECQPVMCACSPQPVSAGPFSAAAATSACSSVTASPSSLVSPGGRPHSGTPPPAAASQSFPSPARDAAAAAVGLRTADSTSDRAGDRRKLPSTAAGSSRNAVFSHQPPAAAAKGVAAAHWMLGKWKVPADYHFCLFRDKEEEIPHAVVANAPSEGPAFSVVAAACSSEAFTAATGKAVSTEGTTAPSKQRGSKTARATAPRKHSNEETDAPLHTRATREEPREGSQNADKEQELRNRAERSKKDPAAEEEDKGGSSCGETESSNKRLMGKQGQQRKTGGARGTHEETQKEIPLLLAAVLLHCQAIIGANQGAAAYVNRKATHRKGPEQRQQPNTKEEKQHRNKRAVGAASPASPTSVPLAAEEEDISCSVVAEAVRLQQELLAWTGGCAVADGLRRIEENTRRWHRWRAKVSVCSDFSGLGVVAPYNKETEKGYRVLCSDTQLKKIVKKIKSVAPPERNMQPLEELVTLAGIAVDESDIGTALQLGRNLFLADAPGETSCRLIRPAKVRGKKAKKNNPAKPACVRQLLQIYNEKEGQAKKRQTVDIEKNET